MTQQVGYDPSCAHWYALVQSPTCSGSGYGRYRHAALMSALRDQAESQRRQRRFMTGPRAASQRCGLPQRLDLRVVQDTP